MSKIWLIITCLQYAVKTKYRLFFAGAANGKGSGRPGKPSSLVLAHKLRDRLIAKAAGPGKGGTIYGPAGVCHLSDLPCVRPVVSVTHGVKMRHSGHASASHARASLTAAWSK
jgi:hypothetical protein